MKTPTNWSKNPSSEANQYLYDSATDSYDSSTQNYDGVVDGDQADRGQIPATWTKPTKTPTNWSKPPKTPTAWSK